MQIGQILLTLPNAYSKCGLIAGVILTVGCGTISLWTMYLLITLYAERKQRMVIDTINLNDRLHLRFTKATGKFGFRVSSQILPCCGHSVQGCLMHMLYTLCPILPASIVD